MEESNFSPQFISFSKLTTIDLDQKRRFNVFAYLLNRDLVKPDGTIDDLNSVIINLGSYNSYESAKVFVEKITNISNYPGIVITEFGQPYFLTTNPEMNYNQSDIEKLEDDFYSKIDDEMQRRKDKKDEIEKEMLNEYNPDSVSYFASQCFLISKNQNQIDEYQKEIDELKSKIDHHQKQLLLRKHNAQEHLKKYPENKKLVIDDVKKRLIRRGEFNLFEQFKSDYEKIQDQL